MPGPVNPIRGPLLPQALQKRLKPLAYRTVDEANRIRSKTTLSGVDHYCVYIPYFDFDGQIHYEIGDGLQKYQIDSTSRYTFFAELNPGANPC